jgi:hypothetical protein
MSGIVLSPISECAHRRSVTQLSQLPSLPCKLSSRKQPVLEFFPRSSVEFLVLYVWHDNSYKHICFLEGPSTTNSQRIVCAKYHIP